jgi:hypothetical protein
LHPVERVMLRQIILRREQETARATRRE